jgi:hypothetical protein
MPGENSEEGNADEKCTDNIEKVKIRAHIARDGFFFCSVDTEDVRLWEEIEKIETKVYVEDDDERVEDSITPEPTRDSPAPVVGTVEHTCGEIHDIEVDLSEWYVDK